MNTSSIVNQTYEQDRYQEILNPYLEFFVSNKNIKGLKIPFLSMCVRVHSFLSMFSPSSFLEDFKTKRILKKLIKNNKKQRKLYIKRLVRSYAFNFSKFNNTNTCYETFDYQLDKNIVRKIHSRENHNTIQNRNIERHWKNHE